MLIIISRQAGKTVLCSGEVENALVSTVLRSFLAVTDPVFSYESPSQTAVQSKTPVSIKISTQRSVIFPSGSSICLSLKPAGG